MWGWSLGGCGVGSCWSALDEGKGWGNGTRGIDRRYVTLRVTNRVRTARVQLIHLLMHEGIQDYSLFIL